MPIANNPTGETHAASLDKVYSIGVWSILKFNNKNNRPIIIERINGFKNKFLIKLNKFTFCFVDSSRKKAIMVDTRTTITATSWMFRIELFI